LTARELGPSLAPAVRAGPLCSRMDGVGALQRPGEAPLLINRLDDMTL
jgi:hypothetical protein